jgi:uncharacterized protein (TIGR02145 family)
MKRIVLITCLLLSFFSLLAQTVTVKFWGLDVSKQKRVPLSKIEIENISQNWQETLYYPDTVLIMRGTTGVDDWKDIREMKLSQNVPNPFEGKSVVELQLPEDGEVLIGVYDMNGKKVVDYVKTLEFGIHQFEIALSTPQIYLLTVQSGGKTASIKMVNTGRAGADVVRYLGVKSLSSASKEVKSGTKGMVNKPFRLGDEMAFVGYTMMGEEEVSSDQIRQNQFYLSQELGLSFYLDEYRQLTVKTSPISMVMQNIAVTGGEIVEYGALGLYSTGVCWSTSPSPTIADTFTVNEIHNDGFTSVLTDLTPHTKYYVRAYAISEKGPVYGNELSFVTLEEVETEDGKPCEGMPTMKDYDNNVYNTVQIGSQCWMKENLRTTHFADGTPIAAGVSVTEYNAVRYAPGKDSLNVPSYGYLYNSVAYLNKHAICPSGWHLPSITEWESLYSYVESQSHFVCGGDSVNVAKALASTTGWKAASNTCSPGFIPSANNTTGFSAMPAGLFNGKYWEFGGYALFASSSMKSYYMLYGDSVLEDAGTINISDAFSVRCLRD